MDGLPLLLGGIPSPATGFGCPFPPQLGTKDTPTHDVASSKSAVSCAAATSKCADPCTSFSTATTSSSLGLPSVIFEVSREHGSLLFDFEELESEDDEFEM